jgi:hypothetical protein
VIEIQRTRTERTGERVWFFRVNSLPVPQENHPQWGDFPGKNQVADSWCQAVCEAPNVARISGVPCL